MTRWSDNMVGRGAALLEVVLSVGVLATAMAFIGAQLQAGLTSAGVSRDRTEALMLAEMVLAELDMDRMTPSLDEQADAALTGDFGGRYPGYQWSVSVDKTPVDGLNLVTVTILKGRPRDLTGEEVMEASGDANDLSDEAALDEYEDFKEVCRFWTFRADELPMTLTDAIGQDKADTVTELLPDELTELLESLGIDPENLDIKTLMTQLDMEQLLELMPMLNQSLGGLLGGSMWDQLQQAVMKYQSQHSSGGDPNSSGDRQDPNDAEGEIGRAHV